METRIQIRGMSCGHCVKAVETALRKVSGVRDVRVMIGEAIVITDSPPNEPALKKAIQDEGFEIT